MSSFSRIFYNNEINEPVREPIIMHFIELGKATLIGSMLMLGNPI